MEGYMGEFPVDHTKSKDELILMYIEAYGQIDGEHHKAWVLDQIARIIRGTQVVMKEARWTQENGEILKELRFTTGEPSAEYLSWVEDMKGDYDPEYEEYEYEYDEGIAP